MRLLLLCLVSGTLLAAAPTGLPHHARPPQRPVAVPDAGQPLSDAARMGQLARTDPVTFLGECLRRYRRDVTGYALTLQKQERLGGKLRPPELIRVAFREEPYAVYLEWVEGAGKASRALYVRGENNNEMLARANVKLLTLIVPRAVDSEEARQSGRFTIDNFGMRAGMERAYTDWQKAAEKGELHVAAREEAPEGAGGRPCYVLHRTKFARPEHDGVTEQTLYIDKATWLQVGSVAKGADGLVGAYWFRDVRLNPEFPPGQFTREALKK